MHELLLEVERRNESHIFTAITPASHMEFHVPHEFSCFLLRHTRRYVWKYAEVHLFLRGSTEKHTRRYGTPYAEVQAPKELLQGLLWISSYTEVRLSLERQSAYVHSWLFRVDRRRSGKLAVSFLRGSTEASLQPAFDVPTRRYGVSVDLASFQSNLDRCPDELTG